MGHGCSCRSAHNKVLETYQYPSIVSGAFATASIAAATKQLGRFFEEERKSIPMKLLFYYLKVLETSAHYERAIVIKLAQLGDQGCAYLARLLPFYSHIDELHLWKAGVTGYGLGVILESISLLKQLKILNFTDNRLKDDAILYLSRAFSSIAGLEELWLSANEITSRGVSVLAGSLVALPKLKSLGLSFNFLDASACQTLSASLQNRSHLSVLELAGNKLGRDCVEALIQLAMSNPPLKLDLTRNDFELEDCEALQRAYGVDVVMLETPKR